MSCRDYSPTYSGIRVGMVDLGVLVVAPVGRIPLWQRGDPICRGFQDDAPIMQKAQPFHQVVDDVSSAIFHDEDGRRISPFIWDFVVGEAFCDGIELPPHLQGELGKICIAS